MLFKEQGEAFPNLSSFRYHHRKEQNLTKKHCN